MPDPIPSTPLEERVQSALGSRAAAVDTDSPDLLGGARAARAARRRRTTLVTGGASVAVVVLAAVALPFVLGGPEDGTGPIAGGPPPPALDRGADLRTGPDGWRQVVFHDVTFAVPPEWGAGAVDQWCIGDGQPVVQLPGTAQTEVACTPLVGHGVVVTPPGQEPPPPDPSRYADGTALAQEEHGGWTVTVSADDARTRDAVARSIRVVEKGDWVNGCPAHLDVPALGEADVGVEEGALTVCHYALGVAGPNLTLTTPPPGATSADAPGIDALRDAPRGTGPDADAGTCEDWPEDSAAALVGDRGPVAWVHFTGCAGHGVDLGGGDTRKLTEDVMRLVLVAGWSGGTIGEIPVPDRVSDPDGTVSSEG